MNLLLMIIPLIFPWETSKRPTASRLATEELCRTLVSTFVVAAKIVESGELSAAHLICADVDGTDFGSE